VRRQPEPVIHEGDGEGELPDVLWAEVAAFEFDDHVPELFDVEEQQVDEEVVAIDVELG